MISKLFIVCILFLNSLSAFSQNYYFNKNYKKLKKSKLTEHNSCSNKQSPKYKYRLHKVANLVEQAEEFHLNEVNEEIANKLLTTLNSCASKIWSGYNLHEFNIVLIDESIPDQIAIFPKENKKFTLPKNQVPAYALNSLYYFFEIGDQHWMAINPMSYKKGLPSATKSFIVEKSLGLALHEGFHHTTQRTWTHSEDDSGERGTTVPIAWEPRFYRSMIYQNLVTVYKSNFFNHTALRKAKYWYDLWVQNYPLEVSMSTDRTEGSAAYVEILGDAFSNYGCEDFNPKIKNYIENHLSDGQEPFINGTMFALDTEGYLVGKVASLILEQHKVIPDWKERLAKGESQLAQLMSLVKPKFHAVDDAKKEPFIQTQQKEQTKIDELLGQTYKNLRDPMALFVSLPSSWGPNGFSPMGFYYDPQMKNDFIPLAVAMEFKDDKSKSKVVAKVKSVSVELDTPSPCNYEDDGQWTFIIASDEFTLIEADEQIQIKSPLLEGNTIGSMATDSQGRKWFCGNIKKK